MHSNHCDILHRFTGLVEFRTTPGVCNTCGANGMAGLATVEGALFALIGLLVAFTVFENLVEYLNLPPQRIPFQFLDGVRARAHRQVRNQLPLDFLSVLRRPTLVGMDHCQFSVGYRFCFPIGGRTRILRYLISRIASSGLPLLSLTSMRCSPLTDTSFISSAIV